MSLSRQSLPEAAADAIVQIIVTEGLLEGDPLPASGELADRFKVSGVVIREALAILSARGVLARRQGREPVVALPGPAVLTDLWRQRVHHDAMTVAEFIECRAALELQTSAMAARRGDAGKLGEIVETMRGAGSAAAFNEADIAFHMEMARLAGNRAIELVLTSLQTIVFEVFTNGLDQATSLHGEQAIPEAAELHADIVRAIETGDPRVAAKATADHFTYSGSRSSVVAWL